MAGAGFKTFNTGDVLTASDVNTYLMQQTVMVFASAAARTTALGANVAEGMISYLKDTNAVEVYDGSNWVSSDDPNAIQNTIVDAKGDIITATAADTPARLAVGSNGYTLVADSSQTTGLGWAGNVAAGRNAVINGGFDWWQRGTSSTSGGYVAPDRWYLVFASGSGTWAQESTVVPTGSLYSCKATASANGTQLYWLQAIETLNAIRYAGQNVTLSAQVAASTSTPMTISLQYSTTADNTIGGTWTDITATSGGTVTPTSTTFVNLSGVFAVPSTAKSLRVRVYTTSTIANAVVVYVGNVQLELGSSPTPFSRAGGTIQGELAACQRYYYRTSGTAAYYIMAQGVSSSTTAASALFQWPVTLRTASTDITYGNLYFEQYNGTAGLNPTVTAANASNNVARLSLTGMTGLTAGQVGYLFSYNSSTSYIAVNAEL